MYILEVYKKLNDSYTCRGTIDKVYWNGKKDIFLKVYKDYTGCDYPKFAKVEMGERQIITEKPIKEVEKEIKENLNVLKQYTNDKRVLMLEDCIEHIFLALENGYIILNKVSFDEIYKIFMSGKVTKVEMLKARFMPYQDLNNSLYEFITTEYETMFNDCC